MIRAGLPVPPGFCVTTAAYDAVSREAALGPLLDNLLAAGAAPAALQEYAGRAREAILGAPVPEDVAQAVRVAYEALGGDDGGGEAMPVAVRSSATAEDLPFASFAGQQDTYLNVVGFDAVLDAVKRCWGSLWTDRAVSYRASNNIDQRTVRLAVVVQRMVDAEVAGVLFTANPLTGKRREAVIDSSPGLGEAVVSGAVNPDHFTVDTATGVLLERRLGDKRMAVRALPGGGTQHVDLPGGEGAPSSLSDEQVVGLARLGERVEKHFGAPQDIEWAIDGSGRIWLTQSRPLTTLYPLPSSAPSDPDELRVYFSINVAQGVYRPFTPMGIATIRLMISSGAALVNVHPANPAAGPAALVVAGQRLFFDLTPLVRSEVGRRLLPAVMGKMEARSAAVFAHLAEDPRLAPLHTPRRVVAERLRKALPNIRRAPLYAAQALISPAAARRRLRKLERRLRTLATAPEGATSQERLDMFERVLLQNTAQVVLSALPIIGVVFGLPALLERLLGDLATEDERQMVLRGLPYNPTTEMDLALWRLARRAGSVPGVAELFRSTSPEKLAAMYHEGTLPPALQQPLGHFLRVYGHRGVAEIDLGLPRWANDPAYILRTIGNYLSIAEPSRGPGAQFQWAAREARAMAAELKRRARKHGRLRGALVGLCLSRIRGLTGLREVPKYHLMLLMWRGRQLLVPVGEELARAGRIEKPEDIFFLDTAEAREALRGSDMRALVRQRREAYEQELGRRHIPRILLSDGTEPELDVLSKRAGQANGANALTGSPASAGVVTGRARVVLDPAGAELEHGEILVAPSTDPGWTPLFLMAGGLVMEMGGAMSHGAVVAREYGIPAVVGVPAATQRIATGQQVTVDGSKGIVSVLPVTSDE
jgi:pyruvate,water dikinase